jgi:NitT/TauT family transport system ATP-binding protein
VAPQVAGGRPVAALELRDVSKRYADRNAELTALANVNFAVAPGSFVSIIGPSGCGKSTLLKIILGVIAPTSGENLFAGRRVSGPQPDIGMVFQTPALLAWRPVLANVLLPIEIRRHPLEHYRPRARDLLALVGLQEFQQHYPRQLSGGMQQRVAICRALIHDPALLLFDEPFGALDDLTRDQMNHEVLKIWEHTAKTIVLVTHNIGEAVYLSDQVIVMSPRPGRVTAIVPVELGRPRHTEMRHQSAFADCVRRLRATLGV